MENYNVDLYARENEMKIAALEEKMQRSSGYTSQKIQAEIRIRMVLGKIYLNEPLDESDILTLIDYRRGMRLYEKGFDLPYEEAIECGWQSELLLNDARYYTRKEEEYLNGAFEEHREIISKKIEDMMREALKERAEEEAKSKKLQTLVRRVKNYFNLKRD